MARHKLILGLIACGSIGMLVGRTLSQTRGGFGAGGGFYSRVQMMESAGIRLDAAAGISPEDIAENLDRIMDMSEARAYFDAAEEFVGSLGPLLEK